MRRRRNEDNKINLDEWEPKTRIGRAVKNGTITTMDKILDEGFPILEPEVIDFLLPGAQVDYLNIGQAKGKAGGGQRRPVRQTQKITEDGSTLKFTSMAVVGNLNGIVGIGLGMSTDTLPSKKKALRNAKLNMIKIRRGCGSWACGCATGHSIPFKVKGKCGSVEVELLPAPKGTGLKINKECAKILKLAGIKDIWSKTIGHTEVKINHLFALFDALKNLSEVKVQPQYFEELGIVQGSSTESGIESIQNIDDVDSDIVVNAEDSDEESNTVALEDSKEDKEE